MIKVFYHICCFPVAPQVVQDQLTKLVFSGLYQTADVIYCFLVGDDSAAMDGVETIVRSFGRKFVIAARGLGDRTYERFTFRTMLRVGLVSPDDKILYMHSKGVSPRNNRDARIAGNIYDWRTCHEYCVFTHHRTCLKMLDDGGSCDTVGTMYHLQPVPHYSGNFWWCRGDYFLSLDPALLDVVHPGCDSNYISPELWICTAKPRVGALLPDYQFQGYVPVRYPLGGYVDLAVDAVDTP